MAIKKITICGQDIEKFGIVLPQNPTETEKSAARELAAHIKEATGVELPERETGESYSIYIGNASPMDRSEIEFDGFVIATDESDLHLFGAIDRGTIYAALTFLEKYIGFRKYEPGVGRLLEGDAHIPKNLKDAQNPLFDFRRSDWISVTQDAPFNAWVKMNTWPVKDIENYGGILGSIGWCHTFEALCDPKIYFEEHPEYYSLIDGERIPAGNVFDRKVGQLCLTNPDVLRIVVENVKKRMAENPEKNIVEVSQNDNQNYCQCENCAAVDAEEGSPSGLMLRFVNAVAQEVEKEYPDVLVRTFAYQYTRIAPKITKPRHNIIIRYCTIEACFRHVLDEGCDYNLGKYGPELRRWGEICDKISIWDYTTNYAGFLAPFPNFEVLRENIKFFADSNARQVFSEDTPRTNSGDLGAMKAYVVSKLLWNPYMSEEEYQSHIDDCLEGYYGAGWKKVRRYMELTHESTKDEVMTCFEPVDLAGCTGEDPEREQYIPQPYQKIKDKTYLTNFIENNLDESLKIWEEVEALAADEKEADRARASGLAVRYLELFCRQYVKEEMTKAEQEEYEAKVDAFFKDKERFGACVNLWTWRKGR